MSLRGANSGNDLSSEPCTFLRRAGSVPDELKIPEPMCTQIQCALCTLCLTNRSIPRFMMRCAKLKSAVVICKRNSEQYMT